MTPTQADNIAPSTDSRTIKYSTVKEASNTAARNAEATVESFLQKFGRTFGTQKDGPAICATHFAGDATRKSDNATSFDYLAVDVDDQLGSVDRLIQLFAAYKCAIYTTWSHGDPDKWSEGNVCARVILPFSRTVERDDYPAVWLSCQRWLATHGITVDKSTKNLDRLMYLPREQNPSATVEPVRHVQNEPDGLLLDVDYMLSTYPEPARVTVDLEARRSAKQVNIGDVPQKRKDGFARGAIENAVDLMRHTPKGERNQMMLEQQLRLASLELGGADIGDGIQRLRDAKLILDPSAENGAKFDAAMQGAWSQATAIDWTSIPDRQEYRPKTQPGESKPKSIYHEAAALLLDGERFNVAALHGLDDSRTTALVAAAIECTSDAAPMFDRSAVYRCKGGLWSEWSKSKSIAMLNSWGEDWLLGVNAVDEEGVKTWVPAKLKGTRAAGDLLEHRVRATADKSGTFDNAPYGLAIGAQFHAVDLRAKTIAVEALKPEHYQTGRATVEPFAGEAKLTARRLLEDWFPGDKGTQKLALEMVGCAVLGIGTNYSRAFILYGDKGRGKSTFLNVIRKLVPADFSSTVSLADVEGHTSLPMAWSRMNICTELAEESARGKSIKSVDRIKALISGDPMQFNPKHQQVFYAEPRATMLFAVNPGCFPSVAGVDDAFRDRWMCLPFTGKNYRSANTIHVLDHLHEFGHELLTLAIEAARGVVERGGYTDSQAGQDILQDEWWNATDTVSSFVRMCLEKRTTASSGAKPSEMRTAYERYCERNGYTHPTTGEAFLNACRRAGLRQDSSRTGGYNRWSHRVLQVPRDLADVDHDPDVPF